MKTSIFLSLFTLILLASCSNNEYAYNEAAANDYWQVSNEFEECYKNLLEGKYKTKYEYNNDEYANFNPSAVAARNLKKNTTMTKEHFNLLKPSEKAQAFHNKTNEYFDLVGNDFADALQAFSDLDCDHIYLVGKDSLNSSSSISSLDCSTKKDSIISLMKNLYSRISDIEDQCLEEQKKYLEAVGLQGK